MLIEPFVTNRSVPTFNVSVLRRLSRLDKQHSDTTILSPSLELTADHFAAIVTANGLWLASPFDDLIQSARDTHRWQAQIDFDAEALPIVVIEHVERAERTTIGKAIVHEVDRPHDIDLSGHS